MTVDAVVNLFIQHAKNTENTLTTSQNEPDSQRQDHSSPVPNPLPLGPPPNITTSIHEEVAEPDYFENTHSSAQVARPAEERCVDLDVLSPPPLPSATLSEHGDCAFCGTIGTPRTCGILVGGCDEYLNLESELRQAQHRHCSVCNALGAAVTCTHAGCRAVYHLPCAALASNVVLDKGAFELWCPKHAVPDSDEEESGTPGRYRSREYRSNRGGEDEDFAPGSSSRPRRHAALSRRHRFQREPGTGSGRSGGPVSSRDRAATAAAAAAASLAMSDRAQRPRTDWQRQGDAWVKVVPPWWCEHRTVHFANKVFRELFCGGTSALLVDAEGAEWDCIVACETRNDMRLQYTLRGQFHDYWDAAGVKAGDVLTFERNTPTMGKIRVMRYPQGRGLEEALEDVAGGTVTGVGVTSRNTTVTGEITPMRAAEPPIARQFSSHGEIILNNNGPSTYQSSERASGGHPNRWTELSDGSAAKTVYKSTLVHQQCPVAGWLFRKLYGRVPTDADTAAMHDPVLGSDFVFEVNFVPAANVHYITGRGFGSWIKESGLRSGDQIRVWRDNNGVKLCKMAPGHDLTLSTQPLEERKLRAGGSSTFFPRDLVDLPGTNSLHGLPAATGGIPSAAFPMSPPSAEAVAALNALAAAAGYARQHGTPAIQAVLSHAAALRDQGEPMLAEALGERLTAAGVPPPPSPFARKRKAPYSEATTLAEQERDSLGALGATTSTAGGAGLQGGHPHNTAFGTLNIAGQLRDPVRAQENAQRPPVLPGQLQLQQALQHLLQQYHAQVQAQAQTQGQPQSGGAPGAHTTATPLIPPFHPAPLSSRDPRADQSNNGSLSQQQHPAVDPARQPSRGSAAFAAVMAALGRHQWTQAEATLIVQFRAKCAVLDTVGREVALMNVLQLQNNKEALIEMIRSIVTAPDGTAMPLAVPLSAGPPAATPANEERH